MQTQVLLLVVIGYVWFRSIVHAFWTTKMFTRKHSFRVQAIFWTFFSISMCLFLNITDLVLTPGIEIFYQKVRERLSYLANDEVVALVKIEDSVVRLTILFSVFASALFSQSLANFHVQQQFLTEKDVLVMLLLLWVEFRFTTFLLSSFL